MRNDINNLSNTWEEDIQERKLKGKARRANLASWGWAFAGELVGVGFIAGGLAAHYFTNINNPYYTVAPGVVVGLVGYFFCEDRSMYHGRRHREIKEQIRDNFN